MFGQEAPESLHPPELHDVEVAYWVAFGELSSDRQIGMGQGPIPHSSIANYALRGSGLEVEFFLPIIRAMDRAYLSHKDGAGKKFTRDMLKR